jgi:hypothetical protein
MAHLPWRERARTRDAVSERVDRYCRTYWSGVVNGLLIGLYLMQSGLLLYSLTLDIASKMQLTSLILGVILIVSLATAIKAILVVRVWRRAWHEQLEEERANAAGGPVSIATALALDTDCRRWKHRPHQ